MSNRSNTMKYNPTLYYRVRIEVPGDCSISNETQYKAHAESEFDGACTVLCMLAVIDSRVTLEQIEYVDGSYEHARMRPLVSMTYWRHANGGSGPHHEWYDVDGSVMHDEEY